jgi:hypothetical protein
MNKPIDKSKRRIPREMNIYPSLEAAVQAHLEFAEKSLEGIDLSKVISVAKK